MSTKVSLVLLLVLISSSIVSSVDEKNYNEYDFYENGEYELGSAEHNDNFTYNYQDYDLESELENFQESELDFVPELITEPMDISAKSGETIELPCKASDSAAFVRIWQKDDVMLFTGTVQLSREMERFQLDPNDNTTLVIHDTQREDSGFYSCRIMVTERDIISLTHQVNIVDSFSILPHPPEGVVSLLEGENATLSCSVDGLESTGVLRWTREGVAFPNGNFSILSKTYDISNATRSDSGFYFCTATSDKGETRSAEIEVRVQFPPKIESIEKTLVHGGRGMMVEISCVVTGEPQPKIAWYKGDEVLSLNNRVTSQQAGNRHLLVINRLRSDDTATYMCYATNDHGSNQKSIHFDTHFLSEDNFHAKDKIDGKTSDVSDLQKQYFELMTSLAEQKENFHNFQKQCEGDIKSLKNLTREILSSSKGSTEGGQVHLSSALENSLFADIERLAQEVRQFQANFGSNIRELSTFKMSASTEIDRLWENVNELHDFTNSTSKTVEDLYDKEIVVCSICNINLNTEN